MLHRKWSTEAEGCVVWRTSPLEPEVKSSNDFQERGPRSNTQDKTLDPRTNFRANSEGEQRRSKTCKEYCTHGRRLLRACYYSSRDQFLPQIWASPPRTTPLAAKLRWWWGVQQRAGASAERSPAGSQVVGQQVSQCIGRSETTVLSRYIRCTYFSRTYTLSIPYLRLMLYVILACMYTSSIPLPATDVVRISNICTLYLYSFACDWCCMYFLMYVQFIYTTTPVSPHIFFYWRIVFLPNFHLKNRILTYAKDFPDLKNVPKFAIFWREKKIPNCHIFMLSSSRWPRI